jgi:hypothetical protein
MVTEALEVTSMSASSASANEIATYFAFGYSSTGIVPEKISA